MLVLGISIASCKQNDYYLDGGLSGQSEYEKNLNTYDQLKQNAAHKFDSLIKIIDLTGTKDLVNKENITFYAVPNSAVIRFQQHLTPSDKQKRNLDKIGIDTLKMLLNRFVVNNQKIRLEDITPNKTLNVKDNNLDSLKIIGQGGGLNINSGTPSSAYRMDYSHMKIPKVDSIIYKSGIQTHNLISKNAIIHVLSDGANFGCGLKVKNYR